MFLFLFLSYIAPAFYILYVFVKKRCMARYRLFALLNVLNENKTNKPNFALDKPCGGLIPLIRWVGIGTHPALIFGGSDSEKLDYD